MYNWLMNQTETQISAYRAARHGVAVAELTGWGWLRITGRNRLDFFQRLSTNDFRNVRPGQGQPTVLTSATGRVIAFLLVYAGPDVIYARTEPGQAAGVARYLNNLIFWNDDIQVVDATGATRQWGLYGPEAGAALAQSAGGAAPAELAPYAWQAAEMAGLPVARHRGGPLEVQAWTIVADQAADAVAAALAALGPALDQGTLTQLRVEAGLPAWGYELSDQVTPLEAGLTPAISFNKGCYTGQEVIARQVNYDKVTRQLVGLLLPRDLEVTEGISGSPVQAGRGRPGFLGSVVQSPALGRPVALAVVPRDAAAPGTEVTVQAGEQVLPATVAALPFIAE